MFGKPRLSFDTSAINHLTDSPHRTALLAGIQAGYFTRLTFPSVSEPLGTTDAARRNKLLDTLNSLRSGGECIDAHHAILTQLVENHVKTGTSRWDSLQLRFPECEDAIATRTDLSDGLAQEERETLMAAEVQFKGIFAEIRPIFEKVFESGTERPANADELLPHLNGDGGAFWKMAANLYERAAKERAIKKHPSEAEIRVFAEECPPFLALMLGLVHTQFEWSINGTPVNERKRVGRLDMFSAIYLPYCDIYVSQDREQRRCLAEIAVTAKLPVEVLSFTEFSGRLMPLSSPTTGSVAA
jgi:hypothetical protein